ncbi:MAG: hypothetical protein IH876_10765 [Gemmatimonadetes bacterium]|nr:hypothetical protein [Gemmatimonadota bacterium]
MAIATNFSKEFYDKLGHEVVEEMVNWFNQTDVEYRTQLRDLNDRNYARFEAKLEQRFSEQDAKWGERFGALETAIERRFSEQDVKWEARFGALETAIERRSSEQDVKWERRQNDQFSRLLKWMFVFWSTSLVSMIGLSIAIVGLLQ